MDNKRSVPISIGERKEMVKQLYGFEDDHILTKVLEFCGFTFDAPLKWDKIAILVFWHTVALSLLYNTVINIGHIKVATVVFGRW
jgi:hypothetical protein